MKIELGKRYRNKYGYVATIIKAPDKSCIWFKDHIGNYYHEDGCLAQFSCGNPDFNLIEEQQND